MWTVITNQMFQLLSELNQYNIQGQKLKHEAFIFLICNKKQLNPIQVNNFTVQKWKNVHRKTELQPLFLTDLSWELRINLTLFKIYNLKFYIYTQLKFQSSSSDKIGKIFILINFAQLRNIKLFKRKNTIELYENCSKISYI